MSTKSLISIVNKDGSLNTIYCHRDGGIERNGLIIYNNYQDIDKVKELLAGGDCNSISEENDEVDYYNNGSQACYYKDMKEYLAANLDSFINYHYFFEEKKNKWSVGFIRKKYYRNDLLEELKAQYYWEHNTDNFYCIVVNEFEQKTNQYSFLHFLQEKELQFHNKMHDMIYSDFYRESNQDNGDLVIYFEPEQFQKNIPVIQEVLNKHGFDYSMTVVNSGEIKHLGKYQESSDKVKEILLDYCAVCPSYNELAEKTEENVFPSFV